jgi:hypothetical protein
MEVTLGMPTIKILDIKQEFRGVHLGDKRLDQRCLELVEDLGNHPDQSIPKSCGDWASTKAAYRFFENEHVTRDALLEPHIQQTLKRQEGRQDVLAIEDTTYLNYTAHPETQDLGPIGTAEGLQGLVVHNTMAVDAQRGEVLGMLHQEVWARGGRHPKNETGRQRRQRARESECWQRGVKAVDALGLTAAIHVMDREGDIYEVLRRVEEKRFVIRACWNRLLSKQEGYLFEVLRRSEPIGKMVVIVPARGGRKAREALVTLRRKQMTICPPTALRRQGKDVVVNVLEAFEHHAPKGSAPLHWVLLTREPVDTVTQCVQISAWYKCRWKIEEFHKSLKTGCHIEQRQLRTRAKLEALLGLYSVIGIMLLRARDAARQTETKAGEYFNEIQLRLLRRQYPRMPKIPTARDAFRAVAQMGGFLARKGDGDPGWKTLWLGMHDLLVMEHGHYLSHA